MRPKIAAPGEPGRPSSLWEIHPELPDKTRHNTLGTDDLAGFVEEIPGTVTPPHRNGPPPPDDSLILDDESDFDPQHTFTHI
jgi:hypothetical protein